MSSVSIMVHGAHTGHPKESDGHVWVSIWDAKGTELVTLFVDSEHTAFELATAFEHAGKFYRDKLARSEQEWSLFASLDESEQAQALATEGNDNGESL